VRIILVHVHLAADDVHLLRQFLLGQRGVLHDVAEDVDGDFPAGVRDIDPIDRAVERRIGVHVTAGFLHFLINAAGRAGRCPFEEHVLQAMRQSGAEPPALVDAAGLAPGLRRDDRRVVILADDERQPVR
jgi:hypothetical protein